MGSTEMRLNYWLPLIFLLSFGKMSDFQRSDSDSVMNGNETSSIPQNLTSNTTLHPNKLLETCFQLPELEPLTWLVICNSILPYSLATWYNHMVCKLYQINQDSEHSERFSIFCAQCLLWDSQSLCLRLLLMPGSSFLVEQDQSFIIYWVISCICEAIVINELRQVT